MIRFVRALFLVYFAIAAYGSAHAQTYPLFRPANGILKGQTTTYVTTAAAAADITATFSGACSNVTYLRGDGTCATPPGTGGGTVNSVGLTAPSVFSVSGSPVTSTGVLALAFAGGQTQNQVLASPNGTSGAVALRALVAADLPAVPLTTGVTGTLPVANGGTGVATITGPIKGNGTSAVSAATSADIIGLWTGTCSASTVLKGDGSCAAVGTVTSVGLTVPSGFSVSGSPVTGSGTLGITGTLNPAAGGTGVVTITGPIKGNGTSAFSAATSADIYGLWTGLCSATTYLRGDGQCQTPSGSVVTGANPTAAIGLTAVNGASGSFLRADGAPALDQSIAPTWTGVHTFSNGILATGAASSGVRKNIIQSAAPYQTFFNTAGAANARKADLGFDTGFFAQVSNDAYSTGVEFLRAVPNASSTAVASLDLSGTVVRVNGTPLVTSVTGSKIAYAAITGGVSTCTLAFSVGFASCTGSTGSYTPVFTASYFSTGAVACFVTANATTDVRGTATSGNAISVQVGIRDIAGAGAQAIFSIMCIGPG